MAYKKTITRKGSKYVLDNINLKILDELIGNGRIPKMEIAKRLSVARVSVRDRIKEMEAAGIIEGYTVLINWTLLDNGGE
jgi:DNA-binding Lrp family transcriptional regulator